MRNTVAKRLRREASNLAAKIKSETKERLYKKRIGGPYGKTIVVRTVSYTGFMQIYRDLKRQYIRNAQQRY